ncbi:hypothetical protein IWX90DRAFT_267843 [Phyllosticta citrichinensis]|uniref:Polycomb protein SUZ12-like zinc finger domain-containing protein n=1 Tax=Phyllosticta citrichinensis TaxID=1130410 RepID=A0ABR1XMN8_9PEZI
MPTHPGLEKQINSTRLLYSNVNKDRRTPFLQRNLTQALKQHQASKTQTPLSNEASTRAPSRRSWAPPNDDLASVIASRHSSYELRLHSGLVIRPPNSRSESATAHASLVFTAKSFLTFSLYRKEEGGPWTTRYKIGSEATLKAHRDGTATLSLLRPPTFPAQVFQGLEKEYNGGNLGTHVGPKYVLKIALQCAYPSDNEEVFEFLGIGQQRGSDGQYLRSYVHHLPRCPTTDKGFEIKLAKSSEKLLCKSEHTLHVDMDWVVPNMSIMKEFNRTIRLERGQCSSVPMQPMEPVRITYRCDQAGMQKPLVVQGSLCPICWMRDFRTVERLQMHMKLQHDRFHFAFKEFRPPEGPAPREVHVRLTFKERTEKPDSTGRKFQEIRWIAPNRPFDLDAFLAGDESWVGGKRRRAPLAAIAALDAKIQRRPEDVEDLPKPARKRYKVPRIIQEAEKEIVLFAMHSRRPLVEGEEISENDDSTIPAYAVSKTRRRSPNMPRTAVEFEDKWDAHMLDERLNSDSVGEAVVRFLRHNETWIKNTPGMLNEWFNKLGELKEDGLLSDAFYKYLTSAASTDFFGFSKAREAEPSVDKAKDVEAGKKRKRADASDNTDPFCRPSSPKKTKLNGAQVEQPSGKENTSPREASLPSHGPASNPLSKISIVQTQLGRRGDDKPSGTAKSTTAKGETRPKAPLPDVCSCICGNPVATTDIPAAITCANIECLREEFHLFCVGLDKRVAGWRCDDCAAPNARELEMTPPLPPPFPHPLSLLSRFFA